MRDHSKHIELDREDAVAAILAACDFHPAHETVPVDEAFGRTLAADALAQVTLPNCLTCNMDSVALRWSDFEGLEPGEVPDISGWTRGVEWQFANTGVGMPEGFDTAVCIENAQVSDDNKTLEAILHAPSARYAGTSPAGSRMHEGDVIVSAGTLVTPAVAAALAGAGLTECEVLAKPKVVFIPTGNELVAPGAELGRGKNIESNSLVIKGKAMAWGGECKVYPIVPDKPDMIEDALHRACAEADIVVLNAGSSKGSDDWAMEILDKIGRVINHEVSHGPGHHSSYAVVDDSPIVGISGPALGATFTTDFYLKPVIDLWYGRSTTPQHVTARLAAPFADLFSAPKQKDKRPGETVIDMGCGTGSLALPLANEGVNVVACDLSSGMLGKLREQAEADGVIDNLDIRKVSWLDSWEDLPVADVFFASRSLFSRDLRETLLKMEAHTRRRVCIAVSTSFSPGHDHEMLKAIGRPEPNLSEATYIVNLLLEMGRLPELSYILHNRPVFGETIEEVRANYEREDGPFTPEEEALLNAHIAKHYSMGVDEEGNPVVLRDYRHRNEWAFISWNL